MPPQRLNNTNTSTSDMSGDSGQYLSGLCTVQFLDEVVQRVDLPKKNEVTAQAVSFDWRRKRTNTEESWCKRKNSELG